MNKFERERVLMFHKESEVIDGVFYWKSNGNVVPDDILESAGISVEVRKVCDEVRDKQLSEFLAGYVEAQKNRTPEEKAEHMFELKANFEPGTRVVDVITGEVTVV